MIGKKHFITGLVIGIITAALFFQFFAPRYTTNKSSGILIKNDKWTGDSWSFINNQWKKNMDVDQNWEGIDKALRNALNISLDDSNRLKVLNILKKKHPLLENITDDDLLERIKIVYSKEILINLYLNNFLKLQKKSEIQRMPNEISQTNHSEDLIAKATQ